MLGSQAIARDYQLKGVQVFGMLQLDMTGYTPAGRIPVVGLISDFVNVTLTKYVSTLIDEYANIGWVDSRCGYGCRYVPTLLAIIFRRTCANRVCLVTMPAGLASVILLPSPSRLPSTR